ncbi:MAG TPA: HAMP domain-containing sensor histidine kinase [Vicinamibacterales bacterium]|nr:HAMP domain-containing sensor histidine kinase [Vicinamibacterales bacterium]
MTPELGGILRHRHLAAYGVAMSTVVIAVAFRTGLAPLFSDKFALITFYPAVMISAWLGGLWPGIAATVLSAVIADYLWIDPLYSLRPGYPGDLAALALFAGVGIVISILNESLHQGRAREHTARTAAERAEQRALCSLEAESAARKEAERANRLKDKFLASVSHELRAPLNAILGWSSMLRQGVLDERRQQRAQEAIHANANRQRQLIEDLLDVARIVSGKLRLQRTAIDLLGVVRGALEVVQPAADAKRINIATDFDAGLGLVLGDAARLQQVLWNLLTNAVKFTPTDGAVHLRIRRSGSMAEIAVRDTGCGIPRNFLPFVFESFRQADESTLQPAEGLGLGLSIVKHLVVAHGGTIEAESAGEGHGATFTVRLPAADTPPARPSTVVSSESERAAAALPGITVPVADEDGETLDECRTCLKGREALETSLGR